MSFNDNMRVNFNIVKPILFVGKQKNDKNNEFEVKMQKLVDEYLHTKTDDSKMAILTHMEPEIQKIVSNTNPHYYSQEDVYSEIVLNLFETLENLPQSQTPLQDVLGVLNKSYSNIDNRKTMYKQSLDDNFSNKENFGLLNVLSDEKVLKPLSSRSPEERQEFAKEIEKLDLGPNSELIKAYYGVKNEPTTYKKLAELRNRSETNIISKIKGGIT